MNKIIFIYICTALLCSCSAEKLTPSGADTNRLDGLVDKNVPMINDYLTKYDTYVLTNFDQVLDFAYQFEEALPWRNAVITKIDAADAGKSISFLNENVFSRYSENMKKLWLPRKVLMCRSIVAKSLGISQAGQSPINHVAVANINSVTYTVLPDADYEVLSPMEKEARIKQMHYIYIAGYIVNVRRNFLVSDTFFDATRKLYGEKIGEKPDNISEDEFFMSKGFFTPKVEVKDFYPIHLEDVQAYIENVIKMDSELKDKLMKNSIMRGKVKIMVSSLKNIGVDIEAINPLVSDFM